MMDKNYVEEYEKTIYKITKIEIYINMKVFSLINNIQMKNHTKI